MPLSLLPGDALPFIGGNPPGYIQVDASGNQQLLKSNYSATAAPAVTDDTDANYEVGSMWFDTTNDKSYVALDVTSGAAVWKETTALTSPAGSDTEIQFNNSGSFGASSNLTWDGTGLAVGGGTAEAGSLLYAKSTAANGAGIKIHNTAGSGNRFVVLNAFVDGLGALETVANADATQTAYGVPNGTCGISSRWTDMTFGVGTGGSATEKMRIDTGGLVGINATAPGAQLHVTTGSASRIAGIFKAAATQTANLTEWQNSAGVVKSSYDSDFNLVLNSKISHTPAEEGLRLGAASPVWLRNYANSGFVLGHSGVGNIVALDYTYGIKVAPGWYMGFADTHANVAGAPDCFFTRSAAATMVLGVHANPPINQTLQAPNSLGTDQDGASLSLRGGNGSATNSSGGNVLVYGGALAGSGSAGNVLLGWDGSAARGQVVVGASAPSDVAYTLEVHGGSPYINIKGSTTTNGAANLTLESGGRFGGITKRYNEDAVIIYSKGTQSNPPLVVTSTDLVGVYEVSPGAQLQVTAKDASTIGQIIKLATTPTADAFQVNTSADALRFKVAKTGDATIQGEDPNNMFFALENSTPTTLFRAGVSGAQGYIEAYSSLINKVVTATSFYWKNSANQVTLELTNNGQVKYTPQAYSGTPSATGYFENHATQTATDNATAGSGTAALATFHSFAAPTLAATNASVTTTDAATLYIAGAPTAGTNQTITNAWGLLIDDGNAAIDSRMFVGGRTSIHATNAPTALTVRGIAPAAHVPLGIVNAGEVGMLFDNSSHAAGEWAIRVSTSGNFEIMDGAADFTSWLSKFSIDGTNGNTSIGNSQTSAGAQLQVTSAAAGTKGQIIKLAATPTANAFEVQDSAGTVQASIGPTFFASFPNGISGGGGGSGAYIISAGGDGDTGLYHFAANDCGLVAAGNSTVRCTGSTTTIRSNNATRMTFESTGVITIADAVNLAFNATTGTKIGTATGQKISLWNATPITQPAGIVDADGTLADITTKFNDLLSKLESFGFLAVA